MGMGHGQHLPPGDAFAYGPEDKDPRPRFDRRLAWAHGCVEPCLAPARARPLFRWVKWASWFESALFAALLVFWLAPGFEDETFVFGLSHGIGYLALCLLIFVAILRREAPWPLLAASLTPVGPFGSVIGDRADRAARLGVDARTYRVLTRPHQTVDNHSGGEIITT